MAEKCQYCCRKTHFVIKCKCEKILCISHRDPDDHKCRFDHREAWKKVLTKNNPVIKADKVEVI